MNNVLSLDLIKAVLSQIPSVTIVNDMTGPVCEYEGHILAAVSRKVLSTQLNVIDLEKEFGGKRVALYQFLDAGKGLKAGQTYQVMDPPTMQLSAPRLAAIDTPDTFVLRFAIVPE